MFDVLCGNLVKNIDTFAETEMADEKEPIQSVQVFGRKKTATAVAYCKRGKGLIKVNGRPLEQVEPKALQFKLQEPVLLLGKERLDGKIIFVSKISLRSTFLQIC